MKATNVVVTFFATTPHKKMRAIFMFIFFSNINKTKHTRKQQKKRRERRELTFKLLLCPFTFGY
jgi:hypothetical protein